MIKTLTRYWQTTCQVIGVESDTTSHREKVLSAVGALVGLLGVYGISRYFCEGDELFFIVASMGASAVLVFAVPHGALSQPWPVIGGNVISAVVGVGVAAALGHSLVASAVAVGGAVLAMYYLRCLHPPGGATALLAVIGGPDIAALGFGYALYPILLNTGLMVITGVAFNALIPWRVYPHGLAKRPDPGRISTKDIDFALQSLGSFTDISAEDLALVYERAEQHARERKLKPLRSAPTNRLSRMVRASSLRKVRRARARHAGALGKAVRGVTPLRGKM